MKTRSLGPSNVKGRITRRGNAAIFGLLGFVLLGFSALSVDVGMIVLAETQLHTSLDAAALGGVGHLDGTEEGLALALETSHKVAAANPVLGTGVVLDPVAVESGVYDDEGFRLSADPTEVNAIRLSHEMSEIQAFFASVAFGRETFKVQASSLAFRPFSGGPLGSTPCFLPIAIPDCHLDGLGEGQNPDPFKFTFSSTPEDAVAWGLPGANPSASAIGDQISGQCDGEEVAVGDPLFVTEGVQGSSLGAIRDILQGSHRTDVANTPWPTDLLGAAPNPDPAGETANSASDTALRPGNAPRSTTVAGPVMFVDAGPDCNAVSFTGSLPITGFSWAYIYDVKTNASGDNQNVFLQIDTVNDYDVFGDTDPDAVGPNVRGLGDPQLAPQGPS